MTGRPGGVIKTELTLAEEESATGIDDDEAATDDPAADEAEDVRDVSGRPGGVMTTELTLADMDSAVNEDDDEAATNDPPTDVLVETEDRPADEPEDGSATTGRPEGVIIALLTLEDDMELSPAGKAELTLPLDGAAELPPEDGRELAPATDEVVGLGIALD